MKNKKIKNMKVWKKIAGVVGLTAILGYFIFTVITFSYKSDTQICNRLDVSIKDSSQLQFITEKEIAVLLERENMNPIGMRMETIHTDKIEKLLKKQPRIKNAQCYKTPSGTLKIGITQREPILRVISAKRSYYIDREGEIMPVSSLYTAYVPVATGAITETFAKGELYDFALFLRRNEFWNAQIEQIDVNNKGDVELIPRVGNQIILLGKLDNYEYKLNKLISLYKNGFSRTGWNCYTKIDLKYDNQVVCTKK